MQDKTDPYGPTASEILSPIRATGAAFAQDLAQAFYDGLRAHAGPDDVVNHIDRADFWRIQGHNPIGSILDPGLKPHMLRNNAVEAGRGLAFIGIESAALITSFDRLLQLVSQRIAELPAAEDGHAGLRQLLTARLVAILSGFVAGQRQILKEHQHAVAAVIRLVETSTSLSNVAHALLDILVSLSGMAAATIARPDANGVFHYEAIAGKTRSTHNGADIVGDLTPRLREGSEDLISRAWRSGHTQCCFLIAADPTLAPWHTLAAELGYASCAAIPVLGTDGKPQSVLSLYHEAPGYFLTPDRTVLLDRLRSLLSATLRQLSTGGSSVLQGTRLDYRERLAQGDLVLLYQPVIDLRNGRLCKVEALARLRTSDGALVPPADFLGTFDPRELRQLFTIGLRQALTDLRQWEQEGLVTSVSVNLPPQAFSDPEYAEIARATLSAHPIDPRRLTMELLETTEIEARRDPVAALSHWRALGIRLAQDDLGSGYSSLLRMERLAVDEVKIDQGLVRSAAHNPRRALHFIYHLTRLLHDLGISVVVEGLETVGLIEAAAVLGADAGQGYAVSRPIKATALRPWAQAFRFTACHAGPTTALGAYATLLLHDTLVGLLEARSELPKPAIAEPAALAAYIGASRFQGTTLEEAFKTWQAVATQGVNSPSYQVARSAVENALCEQIQREETSAGTGG